MTPSHTGAPGAPGESPDAWDRSYAAQAVVQTHFDTADPGDLFGPLAATIARLVGARRVAFAQLDESGRQLIPRTGAHGVTDEELGLAGAVPVHPQGTDSASRVVFANAAVHARGSAGDPEVAPFSAFTRGLESVEIAVASWRAANRPLGVLIAVDSERGGFTVDDVRVLRTAAQTAGAVWRHRQAESKLERLYDERLGI